LIMEACWPARRPIVLTKIEYIYYEARKFR
jgi:hypothetical protein